MDPVDSLQPPVRLANRVSSASALTCDVGGSGDLVTFELLNEIICICLPHGGGDVTDAGTHESADAGVHESADAGSHEVAGAGIHESANADTQSDASGTHEIAGAGVHEIADAGSHEIADASSHEVADAGTHEVADASTREVADAGTLESADVGSHEITDAGTLESAGAGTRKVADAGTHEIADAGIRDGSPRERSISRDRSGQHSHSGQVWVVQVPDLETAGEWEGGHEGASAGSELQATAAESQPASLLETLNESEGQRGMSGPGFSGVFNLL